MTENEALKLGKSLYENITSNANNTILTNEYIEFVEMAIQALEEIQQYRTIQKMIGIPLEDFAKLCAEKVPEECKNPQKAIILTDEDVDKWEAYKKIGTVEQCDNAMCFELAKKDKQLADVIDE